jgi:hexulose-6-phosphate isomerase
MAHSTRRDFLKQLTLTGAGAAAFSWQSARCLQAEPARSPHKILKSNKGGYIGTTAAEIAAVMENYRQLGFDGIEAESPGLNIEAVNQARQQTGVPVHGIVDHIHWKQRLSSPDATVRATGLEGLQTALRDSKSVGGTTVLLVPGKVTGADETHDDVWKRSIIEIRKAIPTAESQGIRILIENVWNGFCEKPEQMRDYIDEINSPWVGSYFDIGNVRKFGKPEEWIAVLGKRIGKLDVKDWGAKNGFCRLGEGDVDWPAVKAALQKIEFAGWATREGNDRSLADTSALMDELLVY